MSNLQSSLKNIPVESLGKAPIFVPSWNGACSIENIRYRHLEFWDWEQTLAKKQDLRLSLVLMGVTAILSAALWATHKGIDGTKTSLPRSMDDYWRQSGLKLSEAETVFNDSQCFLTKSNFLGCAWALQSAADRKNLYVDLFTQFRDQDSLQVKQQPLSHKEYLSSISEAQEVSRLSGFSFEQAWAYLKRYWLGTPLESQVTAGVFNAYFSVVLDPHSYLIPFEAFDSLVASSDSSTIGVGVNLRRGNDSFRITRVVSGSSANRKGLSKGDHIIKLDGVLTQDLQDYEVSQLLKGDEGTSVKVQIRRGSQVFEVDLQRTFVNVKSVESRLIEKRSHKIGVLTLSKFSQGSCVLLRKEIVRLVEDGAQGMILDLRDNPGGDIAESGCIANLFLKKGSPVYEIHYFGGNEQNEIFMADRVALYEGPLAILINRSSASASEVLAGSLQDHGRAVLIGERTFGKGSVQRGHAWSQNERIALFSTEALFYLPSGRTPQIVGLRPDIEVVDVSNQDKREEESFFNPIQPEFQSQTKTPMNASLLKCRVLQMASVAQGLQSIEGDNTPLTMDPFIQQGQSLIQCLEGQGTGHESVDTTF